MADKGSVTGKIAHYIRKNIRNGNWTVGEKIPSENQLCEELGVSRVSVRSALQQFIALGILFDIIGVAVTAANPKPFNSMAAHRVKGAKEALYLIRNAEKVASFCNDVVGDICGIVSGSTATVIVVLLQNSFGWRSIVVSTVVTALISGLTIGGKAIGKKVAMKKSKDVIYLTAKVLSVLHLGR